MILSLPARCRLHLPEEVPCVFPCVKHLIRKALERGSRYTCDDIYTGLLSGKMQLWTYGVKAALVTGVVKRECILLACGGYDIKSWIRHLDDVAAWAKSNNCTHLRIQGRRGWSRYGFTIEGEDEIGLTILRRAL